MTTLHLNDYIKPNWPAPAHIKAFTSTRRLNPATPLSGYSSFNLATHVEDDPQLVAQNRQRLCQELKLPEMPTWLNQVHGNHAIELSSSQADHITADACYTRHPGKVCAILTADCLPILICDPKHNQVAAIHGGWRGLQAGILATTLKKLSQHPETLLAWLGPAISAAHYEVGRDVYNSLLNLDSAYSSAFTENGCKYLLNLYTIATIQLNRCGVTHIYTDKFCTYQQAELFYSYRRDGKCSGRMASMIYMDMV